MTDEAPEKAERFILKPSAGRITVKVKDVEKETKSGLILVGTSHEPKPTTGVVEEVCDDYELDGEDYDPLYKKGDIIIFGKFTGSRVQVDRDTFIILKEADILGRLIPSNDPEAVSRDKVKVNAPAQD